MAVLDSLCASSFTKIYFLKTVCAMSFLKDHYIKFNSPQKGHYFL